MAGLDWAAIEAAQCVREPFDHIVLPQVLEPACVAAIPNEFPLISAAGSFSLADAPPGPVLGALIQDLTSDRFRAEMARIFDLDLTGRPVVVTLRGQCSARDGRVHVDSRSKILSLLLYLNDGWAVPEGRLRLLGPDKDLSRPQVEIPTQMGTLAVFRRSDNSWHGHTRFVGQRRVLQLNYLQSARASVVGEIRHRVSALAKQFAAPVA